MSLPHNDLLVPLSVLALEVDASADQLAVRFAAETLVDDLGRVCVDRPTAAALIAEHQAHQRAAAAAAEQAERDRATQPAAAAAREAEDRAAAAREARQREILAADPDLDALTLMRMTSGDDGGLGRAGRRWDELAAAERRGDYGVMHRLPPLPAKEN